jgi:HSP20 family molecular chaperone IbpA
VNPDRVSAETHNGVLTIRLEKEAQAQARQIPIRAGG